MVLTHDGFGLVQILHTYKDILVDILPQDYYFWLVFGPCIRIYLWTKIEMMKSLFYVSLPNNSITTTGIIMYVFMTFLQVNQYQKCTMCQN